MIQASDDHGLKDGRIVYSIDEGREKRLPLMKFEGATSKRKTAVWSLPKTLPKLKPGVRIMYAVEVTDYYPGREKHVRRSATRELTIVTLEQYMQWINEQKAAVMEKVKTAEESEEKSHTEVKQLKKEETKTP